MTTYQKTGDNGMKKVTTVSKRTRAIFCTDGEKGDNRDNLKGVVTGVVTPHEASKYAGLGCFCDNCDNFFYIENIF